MSEVRARRRAPKGLVRGCGGVASAAEVERGIGAAARSIASGGSGRPSQRSGREALLRRSSGQGCFNAQGCSAVRETNGGKHGML